MKYYAVIDTNVLVSALLSKHDTAATSQVVFRMLSGEIIPIYSKEIMKEHHEVLSRKKFKFPLDSVNILLSSIEKHGILISPSSINIDLPDIKDLPFYEVVMEKRSDEAYLITGNIKHFPTEPFIVTSRQMLDIINGEKPLSSYV